MKTIFALLDKPGNFKNFIHYAAMLSKDIGTDLKVLFVQNPQKYPLGTPDSTGGSVPQVQKNLNEMAHNVKETIHIYFEEINKEIKGQISMEFQTELGSPSLILEDKIKNNESSMILLQGYEIESFWELGSTNMDIIHSVNCPVWIVPTDEDYMPFKNIIYATDYQKEDIPTLKKLVALTQFFAPEITALHICENKDFEEKVKKEGFNKIIRRNEGFDLVTVKMMKDKDNKDIPETLSEYSKSTGADLIVVLKENEGFLKRIFTSSFTGTLLKLTKIPVLVYH